MATRMLIDARHREETRVAVVKSNRIEEFDFESAEHKQLKGNIYLAKVTRVEPSLQAAFVDYGGNRHGFLAFSEIHPDYYQIPKEDRDELLREEAEVAAEEAALREQEEEEGDEPTDLIRSEAGDSENSDFIELDTDTRVDTIDISEGQTPSLDDDGDNGDGDNGDGDAADDGDDDAASGDETAQSNGRRRRGRGRGRAQNAAKASDAARAKRIALKRRYKIQDVIHRRQVLLVQVVKEERGNKGAALTTYLSLAGRYCVLMPNTSHGGGISRKISNATDRKRLKTIVAELKLPQTMGCIIRTAGLQRTKTEIKRDFDYLARLWDEIREKTLRGAAPMLVHTDSDLIKRAIRDIYNRDIEEVMVEGEEGYRAAKDFMKLLMPSHSRRVRQYADPVPLFQRYGAEDQLAAMYNPVVQLKSGGYIVINPTEALVSIDINSGRSTKEHGIEATALNTNLEAAREIARQLRLRDMAGLIVIDFIDMEHHSNSRKVEREMKEALRHDRARIQVGRISGFGLMEMSRQRLRTGVLEASTRACPHCEGTGLVRTASSSALLALRLIEEEAAKGRGSIIRLTASHEATIYVLNHKRAELADVEARYGVRVEIVPSGDAEGAKMQTESFGPRPDKQVVFAPIIDEVDDIVVIEDDEDEEIEEEGEATASSAGTNGGEERPRRKKRRRGRRGGRSRLNEDGQQAEGTDGDVANGDEEIDEDDNGDASGAAEAAGADAATLGAPPQEDEAAPVAVEGEPVEAAPKPRRAPRRRKPAAAAVAEVSDAESPAEVATEAAAGTEVSDDGEPKRKPARRRPRKKATEGIESEAPAADETPATDQPAPSPVADIAQPPADAPAVATAPKDEAPVASGTDASDDTAGSSLQQPEDEDRPGEPPRKGWWQRTFG